MTNLRRDAFYHVIHHVTRLSGYEGESLTKLLHKIQRSSVIMMDRWQIEFSAPETGEEEQGDPIPCNIINNYFSIGVVSFAQFVLLCEFR